MNKENKINALRTLIASEGWKILTEWIDQEVESKEKKIFAVLGDQNKLEYTAKDTFILERKQLLELKEAPMNLMNSVNIGLDNIPTMEEVLQDLSKIPSIDNDF